MMIKGAGRDDGESGRLRREVALVRDGKELVPGAQPEHDLCRTGEEGTDCRGCPAHRMTSSVRSRNSGGIVKPKTFHSPLFPFEPELIDSNATRPGQKQQNTGGQ
jgi:hypothetical protein